MSAKSPAVRSGLGAGWIEVRQAFSSPQDIIGIIFLPTVFLVVTVFLRDSRIDGTNFSLATTTLPGVIGLMLAFNGIQGVAFTLLMEREDGTLLRAKTAPNGMLAYLIAKIMQSSASAVSTVVILLVPGIFLFNDLVLDRASSWVTLLWVLALGLLATMPFGAIAGSLLSNPRNIGVLMFPLIAIVGISGIFFPLTSAPQWMQAVAQVFPVYWIGLGMRGALLPDTMAAVEIADSWRPLETAAVLGLWAVIGLVLAPAVLRRMAQRESGSVMEERRIKAMQ
ncbi:ABC transporter permease [Micromonospora sp. WMMD735]|uniref:ABC transporter permease n=1 Tax=Micromonospora sp. WMMD735 TaxID=3404130 RepID=UPI003B9492E8